MVPGVKGFSKTFCGRFAGETDYPFERAHDAREIRDLVVVEVFVRVQQYAVRVMVLKYDVRAFSHGVTNFGLSAGV